MSTEPYILYGVDPSYFTQKGLAVLRYKGVPFEYRKKNLANKQEIETRVGSHLIPVVVTPEGDYTFDSTPIAFALDARIPAGQMLPDTPVQRIVARVLEDYFDEWVTRMVIHFRWFNEADMMTSGVAIVKEYMGLPLDADIPPGQQPAFEQAFQGIVQWGRGTCEKVGSGEADTDSVHKEYGRLLTCLEAHFRENNYLLGRRPSLGDFTLWGGLEAHFYLDPTPRALMDNIAPSLRDFHRRLAAASCGQVPDWPADDALPDTLAPLLQLIGTTFGKFLSLNRAALAAGDKTVEMDLGYGPRTLVVRKYTDKCRAEIAAEVAAFPEEDRAKVEAVLTPVGCWDAYAA